jgi:PST family polysaccharide transporter
MVSAVTGILTVFGNFGLSSAIIQQPNINQRQMSTLFWLNASLGLALSAITAVVAPVVAWFYHDQRLILITIVSGLGFFIAGLGVQHGALLRRQMRFGVLSATEVAAGIVSTGVGLLMAWSGFSYWSLVYMPISATLATTVGVWLVCGWRPGLPSRRSGLRSMVAFGSNLTFFSALNYLIRNLDNVLIGWRCGAAELGQYAKAYSLLLFPLSQINNPIANAAVPALSRLQDDPVRYRNYYLRGLGLIAYITVPLIIGLGVFSEEIIGLVLGPQWSQAATLFRILAIAALLQPIANTTGWLFTSLNRTNAMARWGLLSAPCFILSFIAGLPWGAAGVACTYAIVTWVLTYPCFAMAVRGTPVSMKDIGMTIYRPMAVGLMLGATMFACRLAFAHYGVVLMFAFSAVAAAIALLLMRQCFRAVRNDLDNILATVRAIRQPS